MCVVCTPWHRRLRDGYSENLKCSNTQNLDAWYHNGKVYTWPYLMGCQNTGSLKVWHEMITEGWGGTSVKKAAWYHIRQPEQAGGREQTVPTCPLSSSTHHDMCPSTNEQKTNKKQAK